MKTAKRVGIYMDHSCAHVMEFTADPIKAKIIESEFTHEAKVQSLNRGENVMHHREQHQQLEYYKKLGELIKNYDKVILFGPTEAKTELLNLLKSDHSFEKTQIKVKQVDKMTENQQHAFVKEYFSKH